MASTEQLVAEISGRRAAVLATGLSESRWRKVLRLALLVQAMEQKQLQKEAVQRLNVMIDELRNSQNADLSAKNLGEEGCIFISEGFAFNDR